MTIPAKVALWIIGVYRRYFSQLKPTPTCRFIPTCSQYGYEAIVRFGLIRGGLLTLWRILRCNPFCRGGYDPVPTKFGR